MGEFPTLGLNFDLTQLRAGNAELQAAKANFVAVGEAAGAAADAELEANAKISADIARVARFRQTMGKQRLAEAQAIEDLIAAASAGTYRIKEKYARDELAFSMAMTKQRIAQEDVAAAASYALNQKYGSMKLSQWKQEQAEAASLMAQRVSQEEGAAAAAYAINQRYGAMKIAAWKREEAEAAKTARVIGGALAGVGASIIAKDAQGPAFVASLEKQAAAIGKTRTELLAMQAAELGVSAAAAPFIAKLAEVENGLGHTRGGTSSLTREVVVLFREMARGDFSRMVGSTSLLLQYMGKLGPLIAFLLNPITLLIGGLGLLAFAAGKGADEQAKMNRELAVTGQYAGVTATQIDSFANALAQSTNHGIAPMRKELMVLIDSGQVTGATFQYMGEAAAKLSQMTGESADKIAASFVKMVDDPIKGAAELTRQYHFLTAAEYERIDTLQKQGDKQGALNLLFKDFNEQLKTQGANVGWLEGLWNGLAHAVGNAWEAMKNVGKTAPDTEQVAIYGAAMAKARAAHPGDIDNITGDIESPTYAGWRAKRDAAVARIKAADDAHNKSVKDQVQTQAYQQLEGVQNSFGGSKKRADDEIAQFRKALSEADPNSDLYKTMKASQDLTEERIRKKYDRVDQTKAARGGTGEDHVRSLTATIGGLQQEIDNVTADPLSEFSAKIVKAADEAASHYADGKKKINQARVHDLAGQKEEMTLTLGLLEANAKADRSAANKAAQNVITADAQTKATKAMLDYYSAGVADGDAYFTAMQKQVAAQDEGRQKVLALAEAQKFGVTSINDISDALVKNAGFSRAHADAVEESSRATVKSQVALEKETEAIKLKTQAEKEAENMAAKIMDIEAHTKAVEGGAVALGAYNRQLAIANALGKAGAGADKDSVTTQSLRLLVAEAKAPLVQPVKAEMNDLLTAQERSLGMSAKAQQYIDAGLASSREQAVIMARADNAHLIAQKDALDLIMAANDNTRQAFEDTGRLSFDPLRKGLEKAIHKAVYDSLLAKPIDIIVRAEVDMINQAMSQLTGGKPGGNIFQNVSNMFAPGGSGSTFLSKFGSTGSGLSSGISQAAAAAPDVFAAYQLGSMGGSALAHAFGENSQQTKLSTSLAGVGAAIGMAIAGPLGAAVGAILGTIGGWIFGGQPSNYTATANFNGTNYAITGDKPNATTTSGVTQSAKAIVAAEQSLQSLGITFTDTIQQINIGQRDASTTILGSGQKVTSAAGDPLALVSAAVEALLKSANFGTDAMKQFADSLIAGGKSIDEVITALQAYKTAQDNAESLRLGVLQYTDPTQYSLQSLQGQQVARRQQFQAAAQAGYYTPAQLTTINANLTAIEKSEIGDALAKLAGNAAGAAASLAQLQAAQQKVIDYVAGLSTGSLSPLSPAGILATAKQDYQDAFSKASGGDLTSLNNITSLSSTFLSAAQRYYGSSDAYASIFDSVKSQLTGLGTQAFADPLQTTITQQIQKLIDALHHDNLDIITALGGTATPYNAPGTAPNGTSAAASLASGHLTASNGDSVIVNLVNQLLDQVGAQTAALVNSNDNAAAQVSAAVGQSTSTQVALAGGLVKTA